jgi:hypothetical protein
MTTRLQKIAATFCYMTPSPFKKHPSKPQKTLIKASKNPEKTLIKPTKNSH